MHTTSLHSKFDLRNANFSPIRNLSPDSLARQLEAFHAGNFSQVARTWEAIELRDDVLQSVAHKRKSAASRHGYKIEPLDDSPAARRHAEALEHFYANLTAINALDENERGSFPLLARQMMDAVGKKYAIHEIVWQPAAHGRLTAQFRFVPLWFFENTSGRLRFLPKPNSSPIDLRQDQWLVTVGPGIMEASSVAFMFKHLPLRDWLTYSERNGMPAVRGVTDAVPGSSEWNLAQQAVEAFGAEFRALMSHGTSIEPIDLTTRGDLPYPQLVERMDRALVVLWRGADLSTLSRQGGVGASLQMEEPGLLADGDASMLTQALQVHVDRVVLRHQFGAEPRAHIHVNSARTQDIDTDLRVYRQAIELGIPIALRDYQKKFNLPNPEPDEPLIANAQ